MLPACFLTLSLAAISLVPIPGIAQSHPPFSPVPKSINWSVRPQINHLGTMPRIAIIIDDLGYDWANAKTLIELDAALTLAIIPFTPFSKKIANHAQNNNKEIMVHLPMAPINLKNLGKNWENSLTSDMDKTAFTQTLTAMLDDIPHSRGVNNHGGSALTQNTQAMAWLMSKLEKRALYFIDSRTTPDSVAYSSARYANIPVESRDVFLDNDRDQQSITRQLKKLSAIAIRNGTAVGIGHPYDETLNALKAYLGELPSLGIELVDASALMEHASVAPYKVSQQP